MKAPRRVLIVRLSSLGDVVHAATVLSDLTHAWPETAVDWVVEEAFAPLLRSFEGVDRIVPIGLRRWRKAPWSARGEIAAFWRDLRRTGYDAVIDLQGLVKSAAVGRIARGRRFGLANSTDGSAYEPLARWFYDEALGVPRRIHVVDRSRSLAARVLGHIADGPPRVPWQTLPLHDDDRPWAAPQGVLLIHGAAKVDKLLPTAFWVGLGAALARQGFRPLLPWGSAAEHERALVIAAGIGGAAVLPKLPLDRLATVMSALAGGIGLDTGLAHMSATLGRPTVQLFLEDKAWRAGIYWEPKTAVMQAAPGVPPALDDVLAAWARVAREQ